MARGGRRPGAGRKSNAELAECRALIDQAVSPKQWIAIFKRMAESDDARLLTTLIHQRWGLPSQLIGGDPAAAPITIVEAVAIGTRRAKRKSPAAKPAPRAVEGVEE